MEHMPVLSEVRWPYTSNLAYVESDKDVEPCHVGCGCLVGAWMALYLAGTVLYITHACGALRLVSDL
jgi:hypothetical protein